MPTQEAATPLTATAFLRTAATRQVTAGAAEFGSAEIRCSSFDGIFAKQRAQIRLNSEAETPSVPIISDPTTQKERKLNSQLFLLNAPGERAVIVLGIGACRPEISFVRTVLLGGGLENRQEFRSQASIRLKA